MSYHLLQITRKLSIYLFQITDSCHCLLQMSDADCCHSTCLRSQTTVFLPVQITDNCNYLLRISKQLSLHPFHIIDNCTICFRLLDNTLWTLFTDHRQVSLYVSDQQTTVTICFSLQATVTVCARSADNCHCLFQSIGNCHCLFQISRQLSLSVSKYWQLPLPVSDQQTTVTVCFNV